MKWKLGIAIALIVGLPLGALKNTSARRSMRNTGLGQTYRARFGDFRSQAPWFALTKLTRQYIPRIRLLSRSLIGVSLFLPIDLHSPSDYVLGHPIACELNHRGRN